MSIRKGIPPGPHFHQRIHFPAKITAATAEMFKN
jgi:hypothetical protein